MVKVKICGITNTADAAIAVEAGADALGFVLHRKSPRYIEPVVARAIIGELPPFVLPIGVFVNEDAERVRAIMDQCGFALAQLHGEESVSYCQNLGRPVLKALRVKDRGSILLMAEFQGRANIRGIVVDAFSDHLFGGTGRTVDWSLATEVSRAIPIVLAGGLTPTNVAVAIETVRPYGVDVSSGVEERPGKKDYTKVKAFVEAARLVSI